MTPGIEPGTCGLVRHCSYHSELSRNCPVRRDSRKWQPKANYRASAVSCELSVSTKEAMVLL
uniref:Uncharacterized protein n=1 Tax=Timema poppense TaxID=170557 RepID=A0A7R9DM73_TIMPO|nr:unnamed protein product [Timema poppensis]